MPITLPEFVVVAEEDGKRYTTGLLPRQSVCGGLDFAPRWTGEHEHCPILPEPEWGSRSEWIEAIQNWNLYPVDEDQDGHPSCTLTSLATLGQLYQCMSGRKVVALDWYRAWKKLSGGYGGVALDTALRYTEDQGFPIERSEKKRLITEVYDLPNTEALASALSSPLGAFCWVGRFIGRGGHAECAVAIAKRVRAWEVLVRGTWGKSYGTGGFYWIPLSEYAKGIPYFGGFAVLEWGLVDEDID